MIKYNRVNPKPNPARKNPQLKSAAPALRVLEEISGINGDIKKLIEKNDSQDAILEITKLLLKAYVIVHIAKALI